MKTKKISLLIITVLMLSTIGGALAYHNESILFWPRSGNPNHGSCHTAPGPDGGGPDVYFAPGEGSINISGAPATVYALQQFTLTTWVENMTQLNTESRGGRITFGISGTMGDNAEFMNNLDDLPYSREDVYNVTGAFNGTSDHITFTLTAPSTPAQYTLIVSAVAGKNFTNNEAMSFLVANGTVVIDVLANPPKSVAGGLASSGDDDDDDDDAAGAISGYILIITLGTIFAISAVLILRMKKLAKKTNRNV